MSANVQTTVVTLGNAVTLAAEIIKGVVGNDIADTIDGQPLVNDTIYQLVASRISSKFANVTKGSL